MPLDTYSDNQLEDGSWYSEYLKSRRRYVIVIIFAFAAILTPPDPITQVGLAIPLLLLYELSILTVKFIEKKKSNENLEDA